MPKFAQIEAKHDAPAERSAAQLSEVSRETTARRADALRASVELTRTAAGAVTERPQEMVRQSAEEAADVGRVFVELLGEQTRHNMHAAAALARAVNWGEFAQVQRDFIGESFARMSRLNDRYLEILTAGVKSAAPSSRH